jgi:hypothetical protein
MMISRGVLEMSSVTDKRTSNSDGNNIQYILESVSFGQATDNQRRQINRLRMTATAVWPSHSDVRSSLSGDDRYS